MNWAGVPALGAVILLAAAFASVVRRCPTYVSKIWMAGWCLIVLHFASQLLRGTTGPIGTLASGVRLYSIVWAAFLFMFASPHYRQSRSLKWISGSAVATVSLYLLLRLFLPSPTWVLTIAALLVGVVPFTIALVSKGYHHPLRRLTAALFASLTVFLLCYQNHPTMGRSLALNAVLFALFLGCSFHLWYSYPRATTGAFVTIAGFFSWSAIFILVPAYSNIYSWALAENEIWNLPKYVVAVGMMLLLLEDQIEHNMHLALHDDLTGLPNRRLFHDRLAGAIERARRTESQAALLLIDLDDFKEINDQFGHSAGDKVLRHVSEVFAGRVRKSDTVARTGGDEFCILLEAPASRADSLQVGQALMQILSVPIPLGNQSAPIGASIGIALYPEDAQDAEALCIAADAKMYEQKHRKMQRMMGASCPLDEQEFLAANSTAGPD